MFHDSFCFLHITNHKGDDLFCMAFQVLIYMNGFNHMALVKELTVLIVVQEIKFEPSVMCEPIDKKLTFRASQVKYILT